MKTRKITLILIIALLGIVALYFAPIFPVKTITTNDLNFTTTAQLKKKMPILFEQRNSLSAIGEVQAAIIDNVVLEAEVSYSYSNQNIELKITEATPLSSNGDKYYVKTIDGITSDVNLKFQVPTFVDVEKEQITKINDQLAKLDYEIIKEIETIASRSDDKQPSLLLLTMHDGNYIEINIEQIAEKMPYYLQMQYIIEQKGEDEPGLIHLNIGDYYEPIK